MDKKNFIEAVRKFRALPAEAREKFLAMVDGLPESTLDMMVEQLQALDAALQKNEEKYAGSVRRGRAMLQQVKEHDLPAFHSLFDA